MKSLSIFGNPSGALATTLGRRCCLSAEREREARVQQPPKMRKISGGPKGKSDLSETMRQVHYIQLLFYLDNIQISSILIYL